MKTKALNTEKVTWEELHSFNTKKYANINKGDNESFGKKVLPDRDIWTHPGLNLVQCQVN